MKKIQALALACSISFAAKAQIMAVNPTIEGGFESGASFSTNGWTAINPSTPDNQWIVSNAATPYNGVSGAHVSNNAAAYAYTNTAARTCHFFRDITIPPGAASLSLSFYWKGMGQVGNDRLLVYTAPTAVIPAPNSPVSPATGIGGATLVWTQTTTSAAYALATVSLPSSLAGATVRLIFTWQNDGSAGVTPGAAVDNVSLTYVCSTPAGITGNSPICQGNNIPLSNIFPGGTWASSTPGVATVSPGGLLTGISAGTSTITYTSGSCVSTAVVSVSPLPAAITGHDTVCLGGTTTFANSVIGGTWSSSYPGVASVLAGSGVITGLAAGASFITYRMPGGCYTTDTVRIVNLPTAITGGLSICPGTSTSLSSTPSGGRWTSLNPGSASVNPISGVVTGIHADVATIAYASPLGGCQVFANVTINPLPAPIISKNILCAQGVDTAYNATPGGTWSSMTPSLASVTGATGHISPLNGGIAVIKYTLSTSCAITKSITINPLPTPAVSFSPSTNTLFTDTTYVTYQWYHNIFGMLAGATTYKTAGLYNGAYYVTVSDEKGCTGTSSNFAYNTAMSVGSVSGSEALHIFPNPATTVVNVSGGKAAAIIISSIDGKALLSGTRSVDVSCLANGIYLITVYDAGGQKIAAERFTKQ